MNPDETKPRIAIVGLGQVGALAPPVPGIEGHTSIIRNHCDAVLADGRCQLVALVDEDQVARERVLLAKDLPKSVPVLSSLADLAVGDADVIVVCTPGPKRREVVSQALKLKPRLLIVEKPLALNSADGESILILAARAGIEVRVNYNRRLDSALGRYRGLMPGIPVSAICRYNKGLFNYASHMVDLFCHWYGPVHSVRAFGKEDQKRDPTISFSCEFEAGFEAVFVGVKEANYDLFEAELYFPDGAMTLNNNGVEKRIFQSVQDLYYPEYSHLVEKTNCHELSRTGGFVELYHSVANHFLDGKPLLGCTGIEGLKCVDILEAVLISSRMNGALTQPIERKIN
jgi:predicted dehydrogenase